ncbi:MAG: hypothetical protein ACXWUG_06845 [Polyangiales bacterium]
MNPIHEAVFASIMLTGVAATIPWLATLLTIVFSLLRKPRAASATCALVGYTAAFFLAMDGLSTISLHSRVDEAIASGGYGPPDIVKQHFAKEIVTWHASANEPAHAALAMLVPAVAIAFFMQRRVAPFEGAAKAAVWCASLAAALALALSL